MNIGLLLLATILQFILGALWYSPLLFGNFWMKVMGAEKYTKEELQKMQKEMMPFYLLQLVLTLITTFVLANNLSFNNLTGVAAYGYAFFMWFGYIAPVQIGTVIWGKTEKKFWLKQSLVMISYSFVGIMLATLILTM
jgi:hypothetical protein